MSQRTWINPIEVHVDPKILIRSNFDSVRDAQDAALKNAIRVAGFFPDEPLIVTTRKGKVYLVAGYRRLRAAQELREEGAFLGSVPVVFVPDTEEAIVTALLHEIGKQQPERPY